MHDYIQVDVSAIPYTQSIELADTIYDFRFTYNAISDVFYVDISDYDGNLIQASEPILLNQPLWRNINDDNLPIETIIPMDESNIATRVTPNNLGDTVQLYIDDAGDDEDDD